MVMRIPEGGGRGGSGGRMSTRAKKAETKKLIKADKTKPVAQQPPKKSVKVKPAANTKPKPPNPTQMEHRFGMGNNRMADRGVPLEARIAGGRSRRDAIAESKLTSKPIKKTKPKLVMEKGRIPTHKGGW